MSSDKLGLMPASLSTAAESGQAETSLLEIDSRPAVVPKPRRVATRKPKVVAATEAQTTQLELTMPQAPLPSLPDPPAPVVAEATETAEPPRAAPAKPRRRSKPSPAPAAAVTEVPPLAAIQVAPEPEEAQPIVPSAPPPAQPLPRLSLTLPKPAPAPAVAPDPDPEPVATAALVVPATVKPVSAADAPTSVPVATTPVASAAAPARLTTTASPAAPASPHPITHRIHPVALGRKRDALQHLLAQTPEQPTLIYTRTKHGADKIARVLERSGIKAAAIHGDKSQGARNRALAGFKTGELKALVITDIAARLLDAEGLPLIISYDLPHITEDYVQRVCRTGSAAAPGLALTLITQEESPQFRAVRDQLRYPLEVVELPGFEAAEPFDPERDPLPRPGADAEGAEVRVTAPVPAAESRREAPGRGRRDRRGRAGRGEARPRDTSPVAVDAVAAPAEIEEAAEDAQPRVLNPVRGPRPARNARKPRPERAARGDRQPRGDQQPRGDRQPGFGEFLPPLVDDDDDGPGHGNSLAAPPPSQLVAGGPGRRRGRKDPFATVVVDENRANIYDERQPDDYRDQWSVLGPDTNRPSWTYAEHQPQSLDAPPPRAPSPPGARRGGPGGGPRGPQSGQPRGAQRHGRPRRAEGR